MNEDLLRALHDEHATALLVFVRRLTGDRGQAEDIVQETLLRAWRHANRLPPDGIRPWLFTTARRLVIDAHRPGRHGPGRPTPSRRRWSRPTRSTRHWTRHWCWTRCGR